MTPKTKLLLMTAFLIHKVLIPMGGMALALALGGPSGIDAKGELINLPVAAEKASSAASAAAQSGSTAAQAVSAAAQAGMMYRILMAQGVMDYFHRKQLDKANQKMAEKMERLEKELRSGKLNAAQFAAIKSAVDEAYQKNAQTQAVQNDSPQSPAEASEQLETKTSLFSSDPISNPDSMNSEVNKSSPTPSDVAALAALSNQAAPEKNHKTAGTENPIKNQERGSRSESEGLVITSPQSWVLLQKNYQEKNTEHKSEPTSKLDLAHESDYQEVRKTFLREMSSENQEKTLEDNFTNNELLAERVQDITNESWAINDQAKGDSGPSLLRGTAKKTPAFSVAEISGGLKKLLKPVRIQKSPFSLEPYSEEEGLHWGFLILGLAVAYGWGKKKASVKSKIPHIIPEVVLAPQRSKNRGLKDRRQITRG